MASGVVLGEYFRTPEEASLRQTPEAGPISDPLRREVLEETLTLRATVAPAKRAEPAFALTTQGKIVTAVRVTAGVELKSGQVILELEGRPVIVLTGDFPSWRDFTLSTTGPDAAQLQTALVDVGLYQGDDQEHGTVGHRTLNAVLSLYETIGYDPPPWMQVPHSEFVFIPSDLRFVERVDVAVGDVLKASPITLASSTRRIEADLTVDQRAAIQPGLTIRTAASPAHPAWLGTIDRVVEIPRLDGSEGPTNAIFVREAIPEALVAARLFEVVLASTRGATLSAARAAVHTSAEGEPFVVVLDGTVETAHDVNVGVVTDTRIEVAPVSPGVLSPGDQLVLNPQR